MLGLREYLHRGKMETKSGYISGGSGIDCARGKGAGGER